MLVIRLVVGLLLAAAIVKWTLVVVLGFAAVVVLERLTTML